MERFKLLIGFILILHAVDGLSQVYLEKKTQHRFAQTYLGLNTLITPTSGTLFWQGLSQPFPSMVTPRFTIGGLHFWGKWDFKINLPLTHWGRFSLRESGKVRFNQGGDLSARFYPWRIRNRRLRPFVGLGFNQMALSLEDSEINQRSEQFFSTSLQAGLSFAFKEWQLNGEFLWMPDNRRDFYATPEDLHQFRLPPVFASIGVIKYFDVTLHDEKSKISGKTAQLEKLLQSEKKLNSISLAIAPSSAFFLRAPSYNNQPTLSLPRHKTVINWDLGLGYYLHNPGAHFGISYRNYSSKVKSYGRQNIIRRQSIALEGFIYCWNFKGFVPFIGPSFSFERWATGDFEQQNQVGSTIRSRMISPGILFGWDILASPLETWLLRTNLRYYPFQEIELTNGKKGRVDQFEFNFIQFVFYPNRMFHVPRAKKK
ncbi:MAG: hypothetical protein ACNS62_12535 [Candidatus Cyclobacteriaceae bacterium M3_2C_046]